MPGSPQQLPWDPTALPFRKPTLSPRSHSPALLNTLPWTPMCCCPHQPPEAPYQSWHCPASCPSPSVTLGFPLVAPHPPGQLWTYQVVTQTRWMRPEANRASKRQVRTVENQETRCCRAAPSDGVRGVGGAWLQQHNFPQAREKLKGSCHSSKAGLGLSSATAGAPPALPQVFGQQRVPAPLLGSCNTYSQGISWPGSPSQR